MKEAKSPKKPLIFYYGVVLAVLLVFNMIVSPLLLERQVYWLLLLDGNEYTIPKWQVLPLVEALRSGMLGA